jgi:hypothetical protein
LVELYISLCELIILQQRGNRINMTFCILSQCRMLKEPDLYGVGADYDDDVNLEQKRSDIIHTAAVVLEKSQLVKYERKTGVLQVKSILPLGKHSE